MWASCSALASSAALRAWTTSVVERLFQPVGGGQLGLVGQPHVQIEPALLGQLGVPHVQHRLGLEPQAPLASLALLLEPDADPLHAVVRHADDVELVDDHRSAREHLVRHVPVAVPLIATQPLEVPLPSFNGINLALRKRQHELSAAATQLADGRSLLEVQAELNYISSTWLDNIVTAVESVNAVLKRPDQLWAILLDELEIVPQALLQTIVDALRSTSNKVRFKLALSPTGSDLLPHDQPGSSSHFEDYRPIKLWYERKNDARDFASRLFASSLSRMLDEPIPTIALPKVLGSSWTRTQDEAAAIRPREA
jgi:hypothetical protein